MFIVVFVSVFVFIVDQASKFYILAKFVPYQTVPVVSNVFHLTLVENKGIAFGLFNNNSNIVYPLVLLGCILLCSIVYSFRNAGGIQKVACGFLIGGAFGNLVDRLYHGAVIDFLDFRVWPVFNGADVAISLAAIFFAFSLFRKDSNVSRSA